MRSCFRKMTAALLALLIVAACMPMTAFADTKTGHGMAEWALRAYNEGWKYVFGGSVEGTVDCSGLIRSYINGGGGAKALLNASQESGDMDEMPNIIGLGLWCEGHAGVYVGKNESGVNMAVDARNSRVNVVYSTMDSRSWNPWTKWFKIQGVEYPTTGWEEYNGKTYYYHDGEFVTGYFTVDGQLYDFGLSGALIGIADPASTTTAPTTTTTAKKTTTTTAATTTSTRKTTTTTTTASTGALRLGDSGDRVAELQRRLIELGYMKVEATGYFGQKTYDALRLFQKAAGLTADGVAGKNTVNALFAADAPKYTTTTKTTTTTTTTTTTAATTTTTTAATTTSSAAGSSSTASDTEPITTTTTEPVPEYELLYTTLDFGASGEEIVTLQARLTELGYYDQQISTYYGAFTRLAVMSFQLKVGLSATGIADAQTQWYLYMENAPASDADFDISLLYSPEDLYIDGGDSFGDDEFVSDSDIEPKEPDRLTVAPSLGIEKLGTQADISGFLAVYGDNSELQTLGIMGFSRPTVTIYHNGTSFELSEEMQSIIDDCAFF